MFSKIELGFLRNEPRGVDYAQFAQLFVGWILIAPIQALPKAQQALATSFPLPYDY
jgi:hypothetical protein